MSLILTTDNIVDVKGLKQSSLEFSDCFPCVSPEGEVKKVTTQDICDKVIDKAQIERIFTDFRIDKHKNALRICFVAPTQKNISYNGKVYTTYSSIETAINTEYDLINTSLELGLLCIVLEGVYYEKVRLNGKVNVSIIGISREKCIVENLDHEEDNSYYYPPFWINPSTTIGNLTINCRKKNDNSIYAYCIHTDDDGEGRVLIKNCSLYCEQHACIGFGTREYAPLYIEDCVMSSLRKCLYGHNGTSVAQSSLIRNEELHIYNCYCRSGNNECIDIFDSNHFYPNGGNKSLDWLVYMKDNVFLNNNNENSVPTKLNISDYVGEAVDTVNYYSAHIRRMPTNSGNNASFLNYVSAKDIDVTDISLKDEYLENTEGGSGCKYVVRNGICYISLDITGVSASGMNVVFEGLPTPISMVPVTLIPYGTEDQSAILQISINGRAQIFGLKQGARYVHSFSYPVK